MSRLVYRAMLRLTAPDEYRRLYGRDDKTTIRKDDHHAPISVPRQRIKLIDRVSAINWNKLEDDKDLEVMGQVDPAIFGCRRSARLQ